MQSTLAAQKPAWFGVEASVRPHLWRPDAAPSRARMDTCWAHV